MESLLNVVQWFLDLGPVVLLPVMVFVMGLIVGMKPGRALRAGIVVGIGFQGLFLILDLMGAVIPPVVTPFIERTGFDLPIVDVDWPVMGALAWASPFAAIVVPLAILVNIGLLAIGFTKTLNVDIWNIWHFIFRGGLAYALTGSWILGILCAIFSEIIVLKFADWSAPRVQEHLGIKGVSFPTMSAVSMGLISLAVNRIIDYIPGLRDWDARPETIEKRLGVLGQPIFIGLFLGIILAAVGGFSIDKILETGMGIAAIMFLLPRMVGILLEGLRPVADAAGDWMKSRYKDRDIYIGMDFALGLGNPAVIAVGLLLVPITILFVGIPGNSFFPILFLGGTAFSAIMPVIYSKGNIVRATICGAVIVISKLWAATFAAKAVTMWAVWAGIDLPVDDTLISAAVGAGEWDNVITSFLPAWIYNWLF